MSVDTATVSSSVKTIDVDDNEGEGDIELPSLTAAPFAGTPHRAASPEKQVVGTPPNYNDSRAPQVERRHGGQPWVA
jgi:hypothetical protein